ncbi:SEC [Symbiodinium sp. KB8]|nr:SEC [Symbiodinium sp. KB8]
MPAVGQCKCDEQGGWPAWGRGQAVGWCVARGAVVSQRVPVPNTPSPHGSLCWELLLCMSPHLSPTTPLGRAAARNGSARRRRCRQTHARSAEHARQPAWAETCEALAQAPPTRGITRAVPRPGTDEDVIGSFKGALYKRKDFLGKEEAGAWALVKNRRLPRRLGTRRTHRPLCTAKLHPGRTYYYRKHVDVDRLVDVCSRTVRPSPRCPAPSTSAARSSPALPPPPQLKSMPNNYKALSIRASCYMKKKQYAEAVLDYNSVVEQAPDVGGANVPAMYTRGLALEKLGRADEAIADFSRVLELEPSHVNAAYSRAACYNRKGLFSQAIEDYKVALSKDKAKAATSPVLASPAQLRKGSFLLGADKYVQMREAEARDQLARGSTPLATPGGKPPLPSRGATVVHMDSAAKRLFADSGDVDGRGPSRGGMASPPGSPAGMPGGPPPLHDDKSGSARPPAVPSAKAPLRTTGATGGEGTPASPPSPTPRHAVAGARAFGFNDTPAKAGARRPGPTASGGPETSRVLHQAPSRQEQKAAAPAASSQAAAPAGAGRAAAEQHHARGFAARKRGDFPAAIAAYTEAIEADPSYFKAWFNRGFAQDKLRKFDAAIADYTAALRVNPDNAYCHYNRGISYDRSGQYEEAIADFSRAMELLPGQADFAHNRGFCHRKRGDFAAAIADYTRALELNPRHFKALYNRAFSHDRLGQLEEALADYTAAMGIDSANPNTFLNRGTTLEKLGRLEEAIADFAKAIALDPASAVARNARGLALDRAGDREAALEDFNAACSADPANGVFHHNRGFCLRNLGRFQDAIAAYSAALEREQTPAALNNRGYAWRKLGRFDAAIADYTASLALDPTNLKTYNNRAYCYAKTGAYDAAIGDYSQVIARDPTSAHAFHNRGISNDKLGRFEDAIADFTKVLELDPSNANAYFNRGSTHDSMGQYDAAIADYTRALDLDRHISARSSGGGGGGAE